MAQRSSAEAFFAFMMAREKLRLTKATGAPWPWSTDPILNAYKFTNVKRENDRTTAWMRTNWTRPNEHRPPGEILFNCALFRYFGTVEFAAAVGWQQSWAPDDVAAAAASHAQQGRKVFTGAYIIPTLGFRGPKAHAVCHLILTPLWVRKDDLAEVARATQSWEEVARQMRLLPGFGGTGFMLKEALQDAMHTPVLRNAHDRNTWCPAGPGARRGLNRLAGRPLPTAISEAAALVEMRELLSLARGVLPVWMPVLELHDIQFQLCEYDKYERVRLNQGRPRSRYRPPLPLT